jgi:hypothetical protein
LTYARIANLSGNSQLLAMEKVSAKAIMCALLPVLLMELSSMVGAVDIIFYESTSACNGNGFAFNSIGPQSCAEVSAKDSGAVLVTSTSGSSQKSQFYRDGGCTTQSGSGSGNFCLVGGQFTGAFWFNAGLPSFFSNNCHSQAKPTGIVYTDDGTKGNWILTTSEAEKMYAQMQKKSPMWRRRAGSSLTVPLTNSSQVRWCCKRSTAASPARKFS